MSKNNLINIFFQLDGQKNEGDRQEVKNKINWKRQVDSRRNGARSDNLNAVRITQFNSLLVIPRQKLLRKGFQGTSSPYKNFNIKKISEFYSKQIKTECQNNQSNLKPKDKCLNSFLKSRNLKKRQSITKQMQKSLITCKYIQKSAAKNDLSTASLSAIDFITDTDNITPNLVMSEQIVDDRSKGLLSQTEVNTREVKCKDTMNISIDMAYTVQAQRQIRKYSASPRKDYARRLQQQKKYQQTLQNQRKEMLEMKKELNKNYAKPFFPPQNITAFSYAIYETDHRKTGAIRRVGSLKQDGSEDLGEIRRMFLHSHKVVASFNSRTAVQIASLTKIMTCVVALDLASRFCRTINSEMVTIGVFQENIGGTSADIKKGEIYSIEQLLYGLMLPSGNDASLAIAVWGGRLLLNQEFTNKQRQGLLKSLSNNGRQGCKAKFTKRESYYRFVLEMNNKATQLGMQKTKYSNTHGLANPQNKSCAFDLCILCEHAMKIKQFREIVACKIYESEIRIQLDADTNTKRNKQCIRRESAKSLRIKSEVDANGELEREEMKDSGEVIELFAEQEQENSNAEEKVLHTRTLRWQNTHQLLQQKSNLYIGIKTGITNTAGPCLASCIEIRGRRFILIVLNCKSMKHRMKDTQNLRKWLFRKQAIKHVQKTDKIVYEEECL